MEKAFLHERLKNPDMESNEMMRGAFLLYRAYLESIFGFRDTEEFSLVNYGISHTDQGITQATVGSLLKGTRAKESNLIQGNSPLKTTRYLSK